MAYVLESLSWWHLASAVIAYYCTLAFYRLFFHPLSRFPGPKLAAVSRWYEAYYDVYQQGQYTFKIAALHKEYGPIVRISPYELHVSDPDFFETLYRHDGRWDKYAWATDAFAAPGATIFTSSHEVHKVRRQPLNPFLSKAKVAAYEGGILKHLEKLCGRLSAAATPKEDRKAGGPHLNLGAAITAFVRDVANDFVLGKSYNSLERDDFDEAMVATSIGSGQVWRLTKHVRFVAPLLMSIPPSWIMKVGDHGIKVFYRHIEETRQDTHNLMAQATRTTGRRTIVDEIMDSKLPPSEKTEARVYDDASTVTGAGFETTASVLRLVIFNVFSNSDILQRLRGELASCSGTLDLKTLERLPHLTAVLMEGLRLSPAIGTRMARISPDKDISYKQWRIPAGTPVAMTLVLMHSDETLYPDPHRFDPERWMDPERRRRLEKAFAPFSRGTRVCLGMHLAWAEMYLLVATLVDRFDFEFFDIRAEDFICDSDNFAIGTPSKGVLYTDVHLRRS
ncbi:cytochrome P450 [Xylariaceae sp. FL0594]|nr:cytochrome P450 [Xylariaceae sp. FL0594]